MGRAPLFLLSFALIGLAACEAEPPPQVPPPPPAGKIDDAPARDAGDASREAIERASETLRKLGAAAIAARSSSRADTPSEPPPAAPVEEARPQVVFKTLVAAGAEVRIVDEADTLHRAEPLANRSRLVPQHDHHFVDARCQRGGRRGDREIRRSDQARG